MVKHKVQGLDTETVTEGRLDRHVEDRNYIPVTCLTYCKNK